jgi:predicted ATPase/DNA-binding SARP family transcriptional activator
MNAQRAVQRRGAKLRKGVRFRVLGPLEAEVAGRPVALGSPKQRALLVALLMRAGDAVPVEDLIDELWPEGPPESARHAVHVYVSRLRSALGDPGRIEAHSRSYAVRVERDELDLARFRALVEEGRTALDEDPTRAAALLREALGLWRGRALADLDSEPAVRDLVLELEDERLEALELRIAADLACGRHGELVAELERLSAEHPAREAFYGHLMLALYRSGRQADAVETYQTARRRLRHELGLEPSAHLRQLQAAMLRQDPALTVEAPALRARRHLPAQPNAFVGRRRELDELVELVASGGVRLVTLTGPGGVGKTRLVLAVAERLAPSFADGIWFVDLAPLADPALLPTAIAQALGVKERPREPLASVVTDYLRPKELLLIVDNLEHLLGGVTVLSDLLREAPRLKILATSRIVLDLYGEYVHDVMPLDLPKNGHVDGAPVLRGDAVELFVERARAARDFRLTAANASTVAEICTALDGLPLALELAAARLRSMPLDELAESLAHRLEVLAEGPRDRPQRQQTLRATLDWSYRLLDGEQQRVLACFGVFAGGPAPEQAVEVCRCGDELLQSLVNASLLRFEDGRYVMLETVREYASERLEETGEADAVRRRHAAAYQALFAQAGPELEAYGDRRWLIRLTNERDNLRAALETFIAAGDAAAALELAAAPWIWWEDQFPSEGRKWLREALALPRSPRSARAQALRALGILALYQGDYAEAKQALAEAVALFRALGDDDGLAIAVAHSAVAEVESGAATRARQLAEEALALVPSVSRPWSAAHVHGAAAITLIFLDDHERAVQLMEQGLATWRSLGNDVRVADSLNAIGAILAEAGQTERARGYLVEAAACARGIGDHFREAYPLTNLGRLAVADGDLAAARSMFARALAVFSSRGDVRPAAHILAEIAVLENRGGRPERAARLAGASSQLFASMEGRPLPSGAQLLESCIADCRASIGRESFEDAWERGRAMGFDEATADALRGLREAP